MINNPLSAVQLPITEHSTVGATAGAQDWKDEVSADTRPVSRKGYLVVALTLGMFMFWAVTFPLSSSVVASGKVVSTGQNKMLQHPTGGVVLTIEAEEGEYLEKDAVIARIEPASAIADLSALEAKHRMLLAKKKRIMSAKSEAEVYGMHDSTDINFYELRGSASPVPIEKVSHDLIFQEQEQEFLASTQRYKSELSILESQLGTLKSDHGSKEKQLEQHKSRLALLDEQYNRMAPLAKGGHIAKVKLWDLESRRLQVKSEISELEGILENLLGRKEEVSNQIKLTVATKEQENSKELTDLLGELSSIEDHIEAAKKMVGYSDIRAPVAGVLTNVAIHTVGGVVKPGEIIAEVVPSDQPLQIESRVLPADISSVSMGQSADVIVTAFNPNLTDPLEGTVSYVSADSTLDQLTGMSHFLARIDIDPDEDIKRRLKAGMFADVFIQTEARTFMSYVIKPIADSFRKAFQER